MSKKRIFIFFGIFFLSGLFINNFVGNIYLSLLIFMILLAFFLLIVFYKKKYGIYIIFSLLGFCLGIYISDYNLSIVEAKLNFINSLKGKNEFTTEIIKVNKITENKIIYVGKINTINKKLLNDKINIEIYLNPKFKLTKGNIIAFESKIYRYEPFNNFNYEKYMISNGIYFKAYPYSYKIIGEKKVNIIIKNILTFREDLLNKIKKIYTIEESIFLGGILVGAREDMPIELRNNFNRSGLTHIIAVSGFNITILIIFFGFIFKFFPSYIRLILISIVIILFTILVGYNPPVIRASIMGMIGYYVIVAGRKGDTYSILLLTAILMSIYSPLSITYDVSLHLSFLAVLGILLTYDYFDNKLKSLSNFLEIRTALSITLSALILTFPVMIFNFGQISIVSPITNVLVAWTIPIIMLLSFIGLIIYYIWPFLGILISFFPWLLLKWDILIVNIFGGFKYGVIEYDFGKYKGILEIFGILIIIGIILYFKNKKKNEN